MVSAAKTKAREQAWLLKVACKSTNKNEARRNAAEKNACSIEVPRALPYSSSSNNNSRAPYRTTCRAIALFTVRELFLNAVEAIMDLERLDDARARNSVRAASHFNTSVFSGPQL